MIKDYIYSVEYSRTWHKHSENTDILTGMNMLKNSSKFEIKADSDSFYSLTIEIPANKVYLIPENNSYLFIKDNTSEANLGTTDGSKRISNTLVFRIISVEKSEKGGLFISGISSECIMDDNFCQNKQFVSTEQVLDDSGNVVVEAKEYHYSDIFTYFQTLVPVEFRFIEDEFPVIDFMSPQFTAKYIVNQKITDIYSTSVESVKNNFISLVKFLGLEWKTTYNISGDKTDLVVYLYKVAGLRKYMNYSLNNLIDDIKVKVDTSCQCTKVMGIGREGLTINSNPPNADSNWEIPEDAYATATPTVPLEFNKIKIVEFSECISKDSLRSKMQDYVNTYKDGEISIELSMKYDNNTTVYRFGLFDIIDVITNGVKYQVEVLSYTRDIKNKTISGIRLSNIRSRKPFKTMVLAGKSVIANPYSSLNRIDYILDTMKNDVKSININTNSDGTTTHTLTYANGKKDIIDVSNDDITGLLSKLSIGGNNITVTTS